MWEIDEVSGQVDGPFCRICYVRMIPEYYDDRYSRGPITDLVFVCRNPECKNHGGVARGLDNVANVEQARHRVHEQIQAEKRREDVAKPSKSR